MNSPVFLLFLALLSIAEAQPVLHVTNAANPLATSAVPGGLLTAFIDTVSLDPAATSVTIDGQGVPSTAADGLSGALTFQVPSDQATGTSMTVQVAYADQSFSATMPVVDSQFGLFTAGRGIGPALATNLGTQQPVLFVRPAHPGDMVRIVGTGLGNATLADISVLLGGHATTVIASGPAPGQPAGTDSIDFIVPDDAAIPDTCTVALDVQIRDGMANRSSIPKSTQISACGSGMDLTLLQLANLDFGSPVDLVEFTLTSDVGQPSQSDGQFVRQDVFAGDSRPLYKSQFAGREDYADDVFYGCQWAPGPPVISVQTSPGSFGPSLNLAGPGSSLDIPAGDANYTFAPDPVLGQPAPAPEDVAQTYFVPGDWQVTADAGGGMYDPIAGTITVPPSIRLANYSDLLTVDRQQDLVINWDPSGYGTPNLVKVTAASDDETGNRQYIVCHADALSGQLTVPAQILQSRSVLANGALTIESYFDTPQRVAVQYVGGGGPTAGVIRYADRISFPVQFSEEVSMKSVARPNRVVVP